MQDNFEARKPQGEESENPEHTQDYAENLDNSLGNVEERNPMIVRNQLPPRKSHIEYKVKEEDSWQETVVINRTEKTTGKNKFWMSSKEFPKKRWKVWTSRSFMSGVSRMNLYPMSRSEKHDALEAKQKEMKKLDRPWCLWRGREQRTRLYLGQMCDNRKNFRWEADC